MALKVDLDAFGAWLDSEMSEYTSQGYRLDVEIFARWLQDNRGLDLSPETLTPENVLAYQKALQDEGLSPATFNRRLAALKKLAEWGQTSLKDIKFVTGSQATVEPINVLSEAEIEKLRSYLAKSTASEDASSIAVAIRDRAIVEILLSTGVFLLELAEINVGDINNGLLHIRGRRSRTLRLTIQASEAIKGWLDVRPEAETPALLLDLLRRSRLSRRSIQARLKECGEQAGLTQTLTASLLRDTFGIRTALRQELGAERVARILGIRDLNVAQRYVASKGA
jgi:integrase/recombinase XerC